MIRLEVPVPPCGWLAINDRGAWQLQWKKTRMWRDLAQIHARNLKTKPIHGRVEVVATIHKATRIRYDLDGTATTVKACVDGVRDAGLIDGDDTSRMARLVIEPGEVRKPACIALIIRPLEAS